MERIIGKIREEVGRHEAPYAIAVRQGWAPAPTNDIQKAVWNRVMAEKAAATNAPAAKAAAPTAK